MNIFKKNSISYSNEILKYNKNYKYIFLNYQVLKKIILCSVKVLVFK